jgi:hypothetical protein
MRGAGVSVGVHAIELPGEAAGSTRCPTVGPASFIAAVIVAPSGGRCSLGEGGGRPELPRRGVGEAPRPVSARPGRGIRRVAGWPATRRPGEGGGSARRQDNGVLGYTPATAMVSAGTGFAAGRTASHG